MQVPESPPNTLNIESVEAQRTLDIYA